MSEELLCVQCLISGKVQGVWFRANTQKKAQQLGVSGWVRNLPDGSVEIKATAPTDSLNEFIAWLKIGPELARVDNITIESCAIEIFKDFVVK